MGKLSFILSASAFVFLASCGGGSQTKTEVVQARGYSSIDDAKINCVARDGFLVPVRGGFVCEMPNGSRVDLSNL